jgi:long-chain fatty acid transport protein
MQSKQHLMTTVLSLCLVATTAQATNGYMSHGYGTVSKGMAGAGTALPQDTLSAFSNPAGLTRLQKRYDVELELFSPKREYKANDDFESPPFPNVPPGREKSENDWFLIPGFGINLPIDDRSTLAFALAGQGGMNSEYDTATFANFAPPPAQNPGGEFTATDPTGVDLAQMALGMTYARELGPFAGLGITRQSIGITPILAVQRFKARGLEPFRALSVSPDNVTDNSYDYSWGGGVRVGWLGSLMHDQLNVGIPATFNAGLAFLLTPKLTLAADYKRIFYDDIDALSNTNDITFGEIIADPDKRLGGDKGLGFGWEDINVYSIGLQYRANERLTLRAGYSDADEPWKNVNTLFNVLAPATVEKHASLGATYQLGKQSRISLAYTHAFRNTIEGTSTLTGPQTGYVRMRQNMLQIGYSRDIGL